MDETVFFEKRDGHYQITSTDRGVCLSVWPASNGGSPVSITDIVRALAEQNLTDYDRAFLSRIVHEAIGEPILIVNALPAVDGKYQITATDAGIYLSVWAPANGGAPVSKAAVMQDLTSRNCSNFDSDFLARIISEAIGKQVLIVSALPTVDGRYQITATDAGVYLSVWAPTGAGVPVSKSAIIHDLNKHNCDFDSDFLSRVISEAGGVPVLVANALPRLDGRYQITAVDTGVHLCVWPPTGGGSAVAKTAIVQDLISQNFTNFDNDFISKVILEAAGVPVLIVTSVPGGEKGRLIRVKVGLDHLEARIDLTISEDSPMATVEQLLAELEAAGVVFGVVEEALERLTRTRSAKNVVCARGAQSCPGDDAYLKYFIDPDSQGRPVELEDGRVDFKEINEFLCVEEGQLLIEKIPATEGIPGTDVFGLPLPAKPGKDVRMPVGKNIVNVDEWRLYAAINGHLNIFLDKRINVIPIIIIDGDVDHSTGNIDFRGSVIVRGSVQPDFVVKAGGNVEVHGTISGGMVEATNIIVRKGIQGMNRSVIKARDRLVATFIESATVYADQDIVVSDVILTSSVFAGMRVIAEGRRGLIRGGRISAGELIRAKTIGNETGVVTELEVSVNAVLKDELLRLRQEIKKARTLYDELTLSLTFLRNKGVDQLSADKLERYKKNEAEYKTLPDRIEEMQQRSTDIEEILSTLKPGRIRVSNFIHPGSRINIGSMTKNLIEPLRFVSFYVLDGEVKFSSC